MSTTKVLVAILIIWLFSIFMAALNLIIWSVPPPVYEIIVSVLCFFIPLVVMLVCYMKIYKAARHQIKKMILTVQGSPKKFLLSKELKAAKTVAAVIGAFVICWGPFFVLNLIFGLCKSCSPLPEESVLAAKWLHYVNSVLNPIIYACMNKDFRAAFKKLLAFICFFLPGVQRQDMTLERSFYSERNSIRSARGSSFKEVNCRKESSSLHSNVSYKDINGYQSWEKPCFVWVMAFSFLHTHTFTISKSIISQSRADRNFRLCDSGKRPWRNLLLWWLFLHLACVQTSLLTQKKIGRRDVCESLSLIVFRYKFA